MCSFLWIDVFTATFRRTYGWQPHSKVTQCNPRKRFREKRERKRQVERSETNIKRNKECKSELMRWNLACIVFIFFLPRQHLETSDGYISLTFMTQSNLKPSFFL